MVLPSHDRQLLDTRQPDVALMLAHRLRRWPNIKSTLAQRGVLTG